MKRKGAQTYFAFAHFDSEATAERIKSAKETSGGVSLGGQRVTIDYCGPKSSRFTQLQDEGKNKKETAAKTTTPAKAAAPAAAEVPQKKNKQQEKPAEKKSPGKVRLDDATLAKGNKKPTKAAPVEEEDDDDEDLDFDDDDDDEGSSIDFDDEDDDE